MLVFRAALPAHLKPRSSYLAVCFVSGSLRIYPENQSWNPSTPAPAPYPPSLENHVHGDKPNPNTCTIPSPIPSSYCCVQSQTGQCTRTSSWIHVCKLNQVWKFTMLCVYMLVSACGIPWYLILTHAQAFSCLLSLVPPKNVIVSWCYFLYTWHVLATLSQSRIRHQEPVELLGFTREKMERRHLWSLSRRLFMALNCQEMNTCPCRGKNVMLDCGIHPGFSGFASLPYLDETNVAEIDVALITHFHLDHCAAVPYLLQKTSFKVR